jgi:hydrogenase maturation factor
MRVLELCADGAMCVDDQGVQHDRIAIELIEPVTPGDEILVHAGVAIR